MIEEKTQRKDKRGLLISSPIKISGKSLHTFGALDRQELRSSLLFWDELVWPISGFIEVGNSADDDFLVSAGILIRPRYPLLGSERMELGEVTIAAQKQAFADLDSKEPGVWSFAQGENSILVEGVDLNPGGGVFIDLHSAIPVPDRDVPLVDILEFRRKRRDEFIALRMELDSIVSIINSSSDAGEELKRQVQKIDKACSDALRISKEWKFPVRLSNLKTSLDLRPFASITAGYAGWLAGATIGMPLAGAVLAGVGASFKIGGDFGFQSMRPRQGPYRYIAKFHEEVF